MRDVLVEPMYGNGWVENGARIEQVAPFSAILARQGERLIGIAKSGDLADWKLDFSPRFFGNLNVFNAAFFSPDRSRRLDGYVQINDMGDL